MPAGLLKPEWVEDEWKKSRQLWKIHQSCLTFLALERLRSDKHYKRL